MHEIDIWNQGFSEGMTSAVKLINEWCGTDCKTIAELIKQIQERLHDQA